jgi:hypothetical protein
MDAWVAYRVRAAELIAKAKIETSPQLAEELETLARAYLILAEMAERSSQSGLTYETPVKKSEDDEHAEAAPLFLGHEQKRGNLQCRCKKPNHRHPG